jgi:hypothetical protein
VLNKFNGTPTYGSPFVDVPLKKNINISLTKNTWTSR